MQIRLCEFNKKDEDKAEKAEFGEKLLCQFYESKADTSLKSLHHHLFHKKKKQLQ